MMLAQNDSHYPYLTKLLNTNNPNGLHAIKVNMTNQHGQKLIDIIVDKLSLNNGDNIGYTELIKLLRHIGSVEPIKHIVPEGVKLDLSNVHNLKNEAPVKKIQATLANKFLLTEGVVNDTFATIESYITKNSEHIESLLNNMTDKYNDISSLFIKLVDHLYSIKSNNEQHNDHNNQWNLKTEIVYTFLELQEQKLNIDGLIHVLTLKDSCPWGKLVNLYHLIEVTENETKPINISYVYKNSDWFANQIIEKLTALNFPKNIQKELVNKVFDNIKNFENDTSSYSLETQLVIGLVSDSFIEFITKMGIDASNIYSLDFVNVMSMIKAIVTNIEYAEIGENNLYDLLLVDEHHNDGYEEVSITGDNNDF